MNIFIETYGCSANQSNSEIMGGLLSECGHHLTPEEDADMIIINTCTVKVQTERKILSRLERLIYSPKKILVTGCMSEVQKDQIEKANPYASVIGLNEIGKLKDIIKDIENDEKVVLFDSKTIDFVDMPKTRINPVINITQIATGCLGDCSYCIVRSAKGALRSFPMSKIVEDVEKSIKDGCKEIWLTAQDTGCYGFDTGAKLPALLRKITAIDGDFRIRIGMMNPDHVRSIQDDLMLAFNNKKIYKFVHLPVQSGSDEVLKRMDRRYTISEAGEIIDKFRKNLGEFTLSTDIIVGFPGETEDDFQKSLDFVNTYKPDIVNISRYGIRPMTRAAKMEQVEGNDVKRRSKLMTDVVDEACVYRNEKWVGWKGKVLLSEMGSKGGVIGRNQAYKPVLVEDGKLGKFVEVEIIEARMGYLVGKLI
ncbi:MAG: tRNA (N(6)-L-threonylcarbamoyladenosine(37)-C(2))-methylthiotransferase [DPANN group archaeon]|nr:tRNA (N(6)-L-threonylcarbamoyladenosine(37)-C(2))-methylthiotransferase [DPANN group archaeon]